MKGDGKMTKNNKIIEILITKREFTLFYPTVEKLPKVGEMMLPVVPDHFAYRVERIIHHEKSEHQNTEEAEKYECYAVLYGNDDYHGFIDLAVPTENL